MRSTPVLLLFCEVSRLYPLFGGEKVMDCPVYKFVTVLDRDENAVESCDFNSASRGSTLSIPMPHQLSFSDILCPLFRSRKETYCYKRCA